MTRTHILAMCSPWPEDMTLGKGHDTAFGNGQLLCEILSRSNRTVKSYPDTRFWLYVHSDLDLTDMTWSRSWHILDSCRRVARVLLIWKHFQAAGFGPPWANEFYTLAGQISTLKTTILSMFVYDFRAPETAERNLPKFDRKRKLNVLYQVSVFQGDRKSTMAATASDWPRHFRLLSNRWTEFDETWLEARTLRPLMFFKPIGNKKQDWRPGLWFSTSLKPRNGICQN